jgi:peptidoglycan-N-acetylglucosamine deacetylase
VIRAALTFDTEHPDRPATPGVLERLLDELVAARVQATFFLQGRWVEAEPDAARAVADAGHVIGNHSHYHARMSLLTKEGRARDIGEAEGVIRDVTGHDPKPWFRCPFGDGTELVRVRASLAATGYRHVGWHIDPEDWAEGASAERVARGALNGILDCGDGAVVLLHSWPSVTPGAVRAIAAVSRFHGIELVGIDRLGGPPVTSVPW